MEIYPEKNVAALSDKNHKIREFRLEIHPDGTCAIRYFNAITVEDYIDELFDKDHFYFYYEINRYEYEFCDSMLEYMHNQYSIMNKEQRMIKKQDCIAIAKDKNFQYIANHFKKKIDSYHENFIKLSHIR